MPPTHRRRSGWRPARPARTLSPRTATARRSLVDRPLSAPWLLDNSDQSAESRRASRRRRVWSVVFAHRLKRTKACRRVLALQPRGLLVRRLVSLRATYVPKRYEWRADRFPPPQPRRKGMSTPSLRRLPVAKPPKTGTAHPSAGLFPSVSPSVFLIYTLCFAFAFPNYASFILYPPSVVMPFGALCSCRSLYATCFHWMWT